MPTLSLMPLSVRSRWTRTSSSGEDRAWVGESTGVVNRHFGKAGDDPRGAGFGHVSANVLGPVVARCARLGTDLAQMYDGLPLPDVGCTIDSHNRCHRSAPLPVIRLHDLRHLHATLLLRDGESVHVVAAPLGHADPAITLRVYAHVLRDQAAGTGTRFASVMAGVSKSGGKEGL